METTDILHAELEELQKKYWQCFNNWECEDDLEKIYCQIEELKYKLSIRPVKHMDQLRQVV
ncbi:MAG TPA: hypothetical protein VKA49_05425 [Flavitalea sp.]|nr:hypothetical protein [Flavitalea sp.]